MLALACAVESGASTAGVARNLRELFPETRTSVATGKVASTCAYEAVVLAEVVAVCIAGDKPPTYKQGVMCYSCDKSRQAKLVTLCIAGDKLPTLKQGVMFILATKQERHS